jgi:hypothetical protein
MTFGFVVFFQVTASAYSQTTLDVAKIAYDQFPGCRVASLPNYT